MGDEAATERYWPFAVPTSPAELGLRETGLETRRGCVGFFATPRTGHHVHLFVHGMGGRWTTWGPLLRAIPESADVRDIALLDFTGVALPRTVADLEAFSLDISRQLSAMGWRSVTLVGHSTGGSFAATFAAGHAGDLAVSSVKVVSGLYVKLFEAARTPLWRTDRESRIEKTLAKLKLVSAIGPAGRTLLLPLARRPDVGRRFVGSQYAHPDLVPFEEFASRLGTFDYQALRDTLAMGRAYRPLETYARVPVPVRQVIGAADPLIDAGDVAAAASVIKDFACTVVDGAGHFSHLERPFATARFLFADDA